MFVCRRCKHTLEWRCAIPAAMSAAAASTADMSGPPRNREPPPARKRPPSIANCREDSSHGMSQNGNAAKLQVGAAPEQGGPAGASAAAINCQLQEKLLACQCESGDMHGFMSGPPRNREPSPVRKRLPLIAQCRKETSMPEWLKQIRASMSGPVWNRRASLVQKATSINCGQGSSRPLSLLPAFLEQQCRPLRY